MNKQEEILQCIIAGNDDRALAHLYQETLPKVRVYIIKNSGTKEEADDLFQDAVIVFFQKVKEGSFNNNHEIDGFIYTICKNLWININKRKKVNQKYVDHSMHEHRPEDNQLDQVINKEKESAMHQLFNKLDERCRQLMKSIIYDRKSMTEICEELGYKNEQVAKATKYRCNQTLIKIAHENMELINSIRK